MFLTGASGFIGAQVARALLSSGCEVAALVVPDDPLLRLIDIKDQLTLIEGDLENMNTLRPSLSDWRPNACVHLAWYAEPGKYLNSPKNIRMLSASLNLLSELAAVGCEQIVASGTCAEYDTDVGFLREDGPTRPATIYAATKLSLCLVGQQLAAQIGVSFAWARLFYPYGPYEDKRRAVPALINALMRNRTVRRFRRAAGARLYSHRRCGPGAVQPCRKQSKRHLQHIVRHASNSAPADGNHWRNIRPNRPDQVRRVTIEGLGATVYMRRQYATARTRVGSEILASRRSATELSSGGKRPKRRRDNASRSSQ